MTKRSKPKTGRSAVPAVALVLAWLIPGAGHVYIGRTMRGVIIFVVITATFWAGVAMGGIMTVDSRTQRWWFMANVGTGVHGLLGWYRCNKIYEQAERELDRGADAARFANDQRGAAVEESGRQKGPLTRTQLAAVTGKLREEYVDKILSDQGYRLSAPAETVARAYAGVAGLLNLLCVFDAAILALMGAGAESGARAKRRRGDAQEGEKA